MKEGRPNEQPSRHDINQLTLCTPTQVKRGWDSNTTAVLGVVKHLDVRSVSALFIG